MIMFREDSPFYSYFYRVHHGMRNVPGKEEPAK